MSKYGTITYIALNVYLWTDRPDCPDCFRVVADGTARHPAERITMYRALGEDDRVFFARVRAAALLLQHSHPLGLERRISIYPLYDRHRTEGDAGDEDDRWNAVRVLEHTMVDERRNVYQRLSAAKVLSTIFGWRDTPEASQTVH